MTSLPFGAVAIRAGRSFKEIMEDFETAISFKELYKGLKRSQRNVIWKDSVAGYSLNGLKNTYKLRQELLNNTYQISQYQRFKVFEPKERDILATRIRDRQFQSSLSQNILYPQITKSFIRDNCACQKGKGNDDALERMVHNLREYFRKYGNKGWVLECDVKRFFPSTSHNVAIAKLCHAIKDKKAAAHACAIIESFCEPIITDEINKYVNFELAQRAAHAITVERTKIVRAKIAEPELLEETREKAFKKIKKIIGDLPVSEEVKVKLYEFVTDKDFKGTGLGSEVSQLVQLLVLNELDHFIKEWLRIKGYERYMDDFPLIHPDKEFLKECLVVIKEKLGELGLQLNEKTTLHKLEQGVHFLKWRFILTDTGKVIKKMNPKRISKEKRKLRKLKKKLDAGEITIQNVRDNFQSWQADAEWGDTKTVVWNMRRYYMKLFKEVPPYGKNKRHERRTARENREGI